MIPVQIFKRLQISLFWGASTGKTLKFNFLHGIFSKLHDLQKLIPRICEIFTIYFTNLNSDVLPILYKSLIRPVLEYGNIMWGPFHNHDIIQVDKVQRRATRLISSLRHIPHIGRLLALNLPSLTYRRKRHGMIYLFQLIQTIYLFQLMQD